ncbi:AAA family ATPase [Alcaligenes phenolicus]|uniref:AAA family ATPase n=1 Tax=Alcaligenes phenolicus TaxID=232846 RepID=A0ABV2BDD3_9BURK
MIRIKSVYLENIKNFGSNGCIFNFGNEYKIHTVSGRNGSGKTALFKAVQVFQKIFFFDQIDVDVIEREGLLRSLKLEIESILSGSSGVIDIALSHDGNIIHIELKLFNDDPMYPDEFYEINEKIPGSLDRLGCVWDIDNPRDVIAFIDAGKSFSDFGVGVNNINLLSRKQKSREFILECIFSPEKTLQAIYKKTVLDHIQYRLDPSRTYEYFRNANHAVKIISKNIEVKNISATKVDGSLVMLGRTTDGMALFDVKDFSSGERALYLTLLFIFYLPNIGILVLDEPENHLHENLLRGFYDFLKGVALKGGPYEWLKAQKYGEGEKNILEDSVDGLSQIFLTTHSKALVYQNLNYGECLVISQEGLLPLEGGGIEAELRKVGVSTVFSKTLFVEGATESSLLTDILEASGIEVMVSDTCKEVIEYFKKISKIKEKIHGADFCFVMDRDNKTESEIEDIRCIDPSYFDRAFIVLDRHEIENLLIDEKLIVDSLNPALKNLCQDEIEVKWIKNAFLEIAGELNKKSMVKYISSGLKMYLKREILDPVIMERSLIDKGVDQTVDNVFSSFDPDCVKSHGRELSDQFNIIWKNDWKRLVDGKAFLNILYNKLEKKTGIKGAVIKKSLIERVKVNPKEYEVGLFLNKVYVSLGVDC